MRHDKDCKLRRFALQIVQQLPENKDEAIKVLEYARQLGYEGLCASSTCNLYVPFTDCTGAATQGAPLSEGPAQPTEFPYGRVVVSWDPNTPVDSSTTPSTNYLQLVEVDLYRTNADCQNQTPFVTGYTSVGIR